MELPGDGRPTPRKGAPPPLKPVADGLARPLALPIVLPMPGDAPAPAPPLTPKADGLEELSGVAAVAVVAAPAAAEVSVPAVVGVPGEPPMPAVGPEVPMPELRPVALPRPVLATPASGCPKKPLTVVLLVPTLIRRQSGLPVKGSG